MNILKGVILNAIPKVLAYYIFLIIISGCNGSNTTPNSTSAKKNDTIAESKTTRGVRNLGLTLPVLNALFFDKSFKDELQSQLQLSDEQIQRLKAAASASVADLSEDGTNYLGSARAAKQQSEEKIGNILGREKADQLYRLVAGRYSSGEIDGLFPTKPNAVPSDTRIVVNAPAFRMDVFQEGKLLKTYRIGIGYPEFPLPTGMRRADTIIFNPTWTPPDEPWVKGKFQPGHKVGAGNALNPLGVIKISIGMPSLIHGGKAAAKLGNFASHGCVGLTDAQVQDFAGMLMQLGGKHVSKDDILNYRRYKKKTQAVKLDKPVLVELRYETIVAENGSLHIFRDVYERGTNTVDNATHVLKIYGVNYESLTPQERDTLINALTEMNLDSNGSAIADNILGSKDTTIKSQDGVAASKVAGAKKGKVTRSVKGQKDIIVPIAALQGKGYPGPVELNSGIVGTTVTR